MLLQKYAQLGEISFIKFYTLLDSSNFEITSLIPEPCLRAIFLKYCAQIYCLNVRLICVFELHAAFQVRIRAKNARCLYFQILEYLKYQENEDTLTNTSVRKFKMVNLP